MAVDMGFAGAQEVEVGAVEEEDGFAHFVSCMCMRMWLCEVRREIVCTPEYLVVWRMVVNGRMQPARSTVYECRDYRINSISYIDNRLLSLITSLCTLYS